ncbi:large conductance mechanosensitive channel protein MscL [Alteromonas sp. 1_MG-2023]|uniref:large conductance mechanosensitive channel protein MscL n=1 Tax=Alteromonas sp. 1_MG-2023 TaxID=3062669 RepID=UPI0026E1B54F|nr:large conductance mechanosensitive channel protein MscL [Alteromonas sp. 1_MG-2023]MDO6474680.1 large conductance mechanosensitive channel protein MscL [Alteromonas sp. 1_MG-2023]
MWQDFKNFIARGNVFDLAVGIIIGAAFTTVVKSLVDDVLMPVIGMFTNNVDFSDLYVNLSGGEFASVQAAREAGAVVVSYGLFINALINFLIVAGVIFMMVRTFNKLKEKAEDPKDKTVKTPRDIALLQEIRDALVKKNEV